MPEAAQGELDLPTSARRCITKPALWRLFAVWLGKSMLAGFKTEGMRFGAKDLR
jgi:hypothetical protein